MCSGISSRAGWSSLDLVQRYSHLSPSRKAEAVERIAIPQNSPTLFPTPTPTKTAASGKLASIKGAPVAQVDRAAVS